jgi:NAD(P)-dependent dehydrogenase (short-subunit alcohol dehydrogenase family)
MAPFALMAKRASWAGGEGPVVAAGISGTGLKDTVEKTGASARRLTTVHVDIADEASVRQAVALAVQALGGLDMLVNATDFRRCARAPAPPP